MAVYSKSFDEPDEQRTPDKTVVNVVKFPGASVAKITFQPGWRWSECIRPVVGGESCQVRHVGTLLSGEIEVVHDDGSKARLAAGSAYLIEPGHDAWVVGDEPAIGLEFESHAAETYAKS
ncbi:cupin [Kribbella capetownensis]|uniref:Cupin n=1 Tax=Kribbella capetownensis TaxID=1572659 RepID=A0A4R0JS55_9ACTN|nr:cupin domain-containing protein [Kribbella capetownensis]TCC48914.1 cupin [Kribbella capetownensis]WSY26022.1 cupin domain-containing protein [Kribbella sp. NBC_00889]